MYTIKEQFKFAIIATDDVIFTVEKNQLKVLLIKMKKKPFTDYWASPGGLIKPEESVFEAAKRHLFNKTGLEEVYLEQLYTFGDVGRDPFGRVVSVAYFALIPPDATKLKTSNDYSDIAWFPVKKLPKLAYDHSQIIQTAIDRIKNKLTYSNIVYSLLPRAFTLTKLQEVYEVILDKKLDKRNFRKKILSLRLVRKTGKKKMGEASRPAQLYKFVNREPTIVEII